MKLGHAAAHFTISEKSASCVVNFFLPGIFEERKSLNVNLTVWPKIWLLLLALDPSKKKKKKKTTKKKQNGKCNTRSIADAEMIKYDSYSATNQMDVLQK